MILLHNYTHTHLEKASHSLSLPDSTLMKDTKIYVKSMLDNLLISDRYQLCVKLVCLQIVKFCVEALARQEPVGWIGTRLLD